MKVVQGVFKYGIVFLVGAWMFVLGVLVGRGTSPVTFDTANFQDRLRVIVGEIPKVPPESERVDLDFYEALNKPIPDDVQEVPAVQTDSTSESKKQKNGETSTSPQAEDAADVPVKHSLKKATFKKHAIAEVEASVKPVEKKAPVTEKKQAVVEKPAPAPPPAPTAPETPKADGKPAPVKGYTIQVAAYRNFKDAVSEMSRLEKKGISSYRTRGESNGTTWYRIRTGTFSDYGKAQAELDRLKQAKINGMIIKKEKQ